MKVEVLKDSGTIKIVECDDHARTITVTEDGQARRLRFPAGYDQAKALAISTARAAYSAA